MSVVFYFMNGCPACEATWPTWKKVKKMAMGRMREVESKQAPQEVNVQSFPTFIVEDENGLEIRRVEGRQSNPRALMRELGMKSKKQGKKTLRKRRTSRPRTTRRNIR